MNTKKYVGGLQSLLSPFYVLGKVLSHLPQSDVVFLNSSRGGTKYLAPVLYVLARLFNCKFVFRPFGGNIHTYTSAYGFLQKTFFRLTVLKSDIFFLQTRELLRFYQDFKANTFQLPTSREAPAKALLRGDRPFEKRFIYLGAMTPSKGVEQILTAAEQLGNDYTIHLYGPIKDARVRKKLNAFPEVYQGVLDKKELLPKLREYDVLILPTFYEGEGYPGVIIEAYSLGIPVISTHWKAIPEIVHHGKTGYLIKPTSSKDLLTAMLAFNRYSYPSFSEEARSYFLSRFSSELVTAAAVNQIKTLFITKESTIKAN